MTINGGGAMTITSGSFVVGDYGSGSLTISSNDNTIVAKGNGSYSPALAYYIGNQAGSTGSMTIYNSSLGGTQTFWVGNYGNGSLLITGSLSNVSLVSTNTSSRDLNIGVGGGSTGVVTVSDGARLGGRIAIALYGTGSMVIDGGHVTMSTNSALANGGPGYLTLNSGSLQYVGGSDGHDILRLGNGSSGRAYVTFSGGTAEIDGTLEVGSITGCYGILTVINTMDYVSIGTLSTNTTGTGDMTFVLDINHAAKATAIVEVDVVALGTRGVHTVSFENLTGEVDEIYLLLEAQQDITQATKNVDWKLAGIDEENYTAEIYWDGNKLYAHVWGSDVPEPSAAAALLGLLALGLAARRR